MESYFGGVGDSVPKEVMVELELEQVLTRQAGLLKRIAEDRNPELVHTEVPLRSSSLALSRWHALSTLTLTH